MYFLRCFYLGLPCLSFDIIADDLGNNRSDFPHSMYLVAGSQAEKQKDNCVIVMKVTTNYFFIVSSFYYLSVGCRVLHFEIH